MQDILSWSIIVLERKLKIILSRTSLNNIGKKLSAVGWKRVVELVGIRRTMCTQWAEEPMSLLDESMTTLR